MNFLPLHWLYNRIWNECFHLPSHQIEFCLITFGISTHPGLFTGKMLQRHQLKYWPCSHILIGIFFLWTTELHCCSKKRFKRHQWATVLHKVITPQLKILLSRLENCSCYLKKQTNIWHLKLGPLTCRTDLFAASLVDGSSQTWHTKGCDL